MTHDRPISFDEVHSALADALVEATAELVHKRVARGGSADGNLRDGGDHQAPLTPAAD
jgi:hypothetical protein